VNKGDGRGAQRCKQTALLPKSINDYADISIRDHALTLPVVSAADQGAHMLQRESRHGPLDPSQKDAPPLALLLLELLLVLMVVLNLLLPLLLLLSQLLSHPLPPLLLPHLLSLLNAVLDLTIALTSLSELLVCDFRGCERQSLLYAQSRGEITDLWLILWSADRPTLLYASST
jgi:hypothetical protein